MRTLKRKVILATVPLVILVAALLMTIRARDTGPPAAVNFLRYEDDGQTAILQITNLSRSPVVYDCWAFYSLRAGRTNRMDVLGDHVHGVEAHQGLELRIPMKILANSDVRPSSIQVRYGLREDQFLARFRRLLRSLDASTKAERFEATFDLSK